MKFNELFHHREAQSGPLEPSRQPAVDLAERPEEQLESLRRDADARVGHADPDELGESIRRLWQASALPLAIEPTDLILPDSVRLHRHGAALGRELHRVGEEIVDDLLQLARVRLDGAQFVDRLDAQSDVAARGLLANDGKAVRE